MFVGCGETATTLRGVCALKFVSPKFDRAHELLLLALIPEGQLISVLFQEAVPAARGGPCQATRADQLDGASQTEAVRNDQTVIMFQPCAAVSAGHWSQWKSACVETPEVCCCQQEGSRSLASQWGGSRAWPWPPLSVHGSSSADRHAEGHQASPETLSPAHDQQERGRVLSGTPPGRPPENKGWHRCRRASAAEGARELGLLTVLVAPDKLPCSPSLHSLEPHVLATPKQLY